MLRALGAAPPPAGGARSPRRPAATARPPAGSLDGYAARGVCEGRGRERSRALGGWRVQRVPRRVHRGRAHRAAASVSACPLCWAADVY